MEANPLQRWASIVRQSREAEHRWKRMSANLSGQSKLYAQALIHHLRVSGPSKLAVLVESPMRLVQFGEMVWRLEKQVRTQPEVRTRNHGERFWLSWHEADQEWRVSTVHTVQVRGEEGREHQTKSLLVVGGSHSSAPPARAEAPVATL